MVLLLGSIVINMVSSHDQTCCKENVLSFSFNRAYSIMVNKDDLTKKNARMKQVLKEDGYQHCVKNVRIWSYSSPYFHVFGLNSEIYEVSLRIQTKCVKIRSRITPTTDTFGTVQESMISKIFK